MAIPSARIELPRVKRRKAPWLLLVLLVLAYLVLWAAGAFLVVGDRTQPVDVIVLLSGGHETRLEEAVRLYKSGTANRLLITETGAIPEGGGPRASTLLQRQAQAAGVPEGAIATTMGRSASTVDEAAAVLAFCDRQGVRSVLVVTDPYHTRRTLMIFDSAFSGSGVQVLVRPVRGHWYQSSTWMFSLPGWRATVLEYAKLAAALAGIPGD